MPNTFKSTSTAITTATVTLYQAPTTASNVSVVLSCMVANVNGTAPADLTLSKTSSADVLQSHLVFTVPIPQDTSLEIVANKVVLMAGEKLRASASIASYLQATVSVLEIT
jgi:predicted NAD/FAD-dependent oxidoreductase